MIGEIEVLTKEEYCFRVLRKYGVLVDFQGEVGKTNVPSPADESETFAQWTKRVLGTQVSDVVVYAPREISGNQRIENVQSSVRHQHLQGVIRAQAKVKDELASVKTDKAVEKVEHRYATFSRDTIEDHLIELGDTLEASVQEFFTRAMKAAPDEIGAEQLLKELICKFNELAHAHRVALGRH